MAYGPWGIFLLALVDSLGVPLPAAMDVSLLFIAAGSAHHPRSAYFAALMAVLGSVAGNIGLFIGSRQGARWLSRGEPAGGRGGRFREWFQRYGLLTVFVPAVVPFIPLPLKVFVVSAGALRTSFGRFLAVIAVARGIRYFGEAWLGLQLGPTRRAFWPVTRGRSPAARWRCAWACTC